MNKRIPRIGIGGPVGCGKSMLIERVVPLLAKKNYRISIISNDVISQEDADRMRQNLATDQGLLPENLVIGLATGGCPHTAVREDPSINLSVIEQLESEHSDLDLIIIESGVIILQQHLVLPWLIILFILLMFQGVTNIQGKEVWA